MDKLLLVHAAATWCMTGLIWFVQIVHYPLMVGVGSSVFPAYEDAHTRRTTWVVGPLMLVEATTGLCLVSIARGLVDSTQAWIGLGLLAAIWISTAFLQVPQHRRLQRGFDRRAHALLVGTNWLRTVAWTLRAALVTIWVG